MARRQVNIFINGKEVANQIKPIRAEKRKLVNELNNMTIGTKEYQDKMKELDKVNAILNKHRKGIRGVESTWKKMLPSIAKFGATAGLAFGVTEIINYGKQLFKAGVEIDTLSRKAETVLAEALGFVTQKARENAAAMGLTTSQYIDATTAIADLLIPMGFQREEAAKISTGLVDLSGALAEWSGGQRSAEEVTKILGKAILGEREQLKELGISIQEADVKARLAEKGLSNLTGTMLQQAKAAATLELITEKSADAQAAYAANSESAIRRQQELTAKITELGERLAVVLLPVFERLVSVASAVIDFFDGVATGIESIIDPAKAATNAFEEQELKVDGLTSTLDPLLSRYDELSSKTNLTEAEQQELKKVIEDIGGVVPTAITEFDNYGKALDINTAKVQDFIDAQKLLLTQKNKEAIDENNESLETLKKRLEGVNAALTNRDADGDIFKTTRSGLRKTHDGFEPVIKDVKLTADEIRNLQAEASALEKQLNTTTNAIKILSGEKITDGAAAPTGTGPAPDDGTAERERLAAESKRIERAKAAEKERVRAEKEAARAEERAIKQAAKEAAALEKKLTRLEEIRQQYADEAAQKRLSRDFQEVAALAKKFNDQIELAKQLEAEGMAGALEQRLALERLRDEEVSRLKAEQAEANIQRQREEDLALAESKVETKREIQELVREELLTDRELELLELEEHFQKMIALAEANGISTLGITEAFRRKKAKLEAKFDKEDKDSRQQALKSQAELLGESFQAATDIIGSAMQSLTALGIENTGIGKALALAQIGISSAEAIAKATAAASGIPFPGNIPAIAAAVGTVVGNMANARKILNTTAVPQKKEGGYKNGESYTVMGEDDRKRYNAQYIGSPTTGMLPDKPVLLASEAGQEYFVSNPALQIPEVVNHVRMIDNITKRQFMNGGFTNDSSTDTTPLPISSFDSFDQNDIGPEDTQQLLLSAVTRLVELLENPIVAVLPDDTIVDANDRLTELDEASGGVIR